MVFQLRFKGTNVTVNFLSIKKAPKLTFEAFVLAISTA